MESGELDKRVGEYAAAIVRDVDLLLADTSNLATEQQQALKVIKNSTLRFLALYSEHLSEFAELNDKSHMVAFDLREPLSIIAGYSELLGTEEFGILNEAQLKLVQQIRDTTKYISNALAAWINTNHQGG